MLCFIPKKANYYPFTDQGSTCQIQARSQTHVTHSDRLPVCVCVLKPSNPAVFQPTKQSASHSQALSPRQKKRWSSLAPLHMMQMSFERKFSNYYRMQIIFLCVFLTTSLFIRPAHVSTRCTTSRSLNQTKAIFNSSNYNSSYNYTQET